MSDIFLMTSEKDEWQWETCVSLANISHRQDETLAQSTIKKKEKCNVWHYRVSGQRTAINHTRQSIDRRINFSPGNVTPLKIFFSCIIFRWLFLSRREKGRGISFQGYHTTSNISAIFSRRDLREKALAFRSSMITITHDRAPLIRIVCHSPSGGNARSVLFQFGVVATSAMWRY